MMEETGALVFVAICRTCNDLFRSEVSHKRNKWAQSHEKKSHRVGYLSRPIEERDSE